MSRSVTSIVALCFAALTVSSACIASDDRESRLVRYDDLNLSRSDHVKLLQQRVERAANAICTDATGPSPAARVDAACKADALRAARAHLDELIAQQAIGPDPEARLAAGLAPAV